MNSLEIPAPAPHWKQDLWIYLALLASTFAVYAQVRHFDFINLDDGIYILNNPHIVGGFRGDSLKWAFQPNTIVGNWHPLTWLSHLLDSQLFGLDPGWHHLTNVWLHAAASMILFAFLRRATGAQWASALAAFVFALHPLHVESVAWVSERKDVLSAVFWFLTLWMYVRYAERPSARRYGAMVICFVLGLMAKPMLVTLPFVLLLLDFWPLCRARSAWQLVREKLPLFALSAAAAVITYTVQEAGGAVMQSSKASLGLRVGNALTSYVWYLWKTIWPAGLSAYYPFPKSIPAWQALLAAAALAAVTLLVLRVVRTRPYLAVGWFWFLGTLVPVIGFVQVGRQSHADRYMYIPMVGLTMMAAWSLPHMKTAWLAGAVACACCGAATYLQLGYWRDSETLFRRALEVTPENPVAEHRLGAALTHDPFRQQEAIAHLQAAARATPDDAGLLSDLGIALAKVGRTDEAIAEFRVVERLTPNSAEEHYNFGDILVKAGRIADAIPEFETALRINPRFAAARKNLVMAELVLAANERALPFLTEGAELARSGHYQEAAVAFRQGLSIQPDNAQAHNELGKVLAKIPGKWAEAISEFQVALTLRNDFPEALHNLEIAKKRTSGRQ